MGETEADTHKARRKRQGVAAVMATAREEMGWSQAWSDTQPAVSLPRLLLTPTEEIRTAACALVRPRDITAEGRCV